MTRNPSGTPDGGTGAAGARRRNAAPAAPDAARRVPAARAAATPSHRDLGLALYRVRLEKGLSLRALAQQLGYSSHSMFAELEKARRLPSEALLRTYENRFSLPPRSLLDLRQQALVERAARLLPGQGADTAPQPAVPAPAQPPAPPAAAPAPRGGGPAGFLRAVRERLRGRRRTDGGT